MANTSTKTRIILKNDDLSNWQGSNLSLHAGEIALALREDGSYEMKIGTGDKTWSQLTGTNFVISADQVLGLQQSIAELSTSHYEVTSIAGISLTGGGNYNNGDTAVVKTLIAGEGANAKYSYTAYVFDSSLTVETATDTQSPSGSWRAMDGNYNAENIYFDSDISCAGSYTQVGNINKTPTGVTTIASKGKSLEKVMETIFTKELTGTTIKPSVTINTSQTRVEYGTELTVNYQLTFNHGSYQYGPSPVGTELSAWNVKTNGTLLDFSNICADVVTQNNVTASPSALTATFASLTTLVSAIYQVSATAEYTEASAVPKTNLGNPDDTAANFISGGTTSASTRDLYLVYRPRYVMMTNSFQTPPSSFNANDLSNATQISGDTLKLTTFNTWYKIIDNKWPTVIEVKNNYYNVFFAAPKGIRSNWTAKKSDNVNVLPTSENPSDADMTYKNGDTGTYSVYQINNQTPYDDNKCNITWVS